ncbi:MAG TPA: O-antigen ligase family protein [Gaiellaceae bacterium]|nr:O-antigen ligase family protein [Gaiellaceae bacterium]
MTDLARIGGPVACIGLAVLLVATARRDRIAGLGFGVLGAIVLGAAMAPHHPWHDVAEVVAAVVVGGALAAAFHRVPWLLPVSALAVVPVRVGALGHQLLVPLYLVVLGGAALLAWELLRGDDRSRELRVASWPLALYLGWTGLSLAWSGDVHEGAVELLAFYVPFTMLALVIARLPWSGLGVKALHLEIAVMALIFAAVGFYQYDTRNVFENPKVINSNAYAPFFRVNSVFWDPSIYGRFLVIAIIPSVVLIVLGRSLRLAWAAAAVVLVTWLGLLISFSQSSFAALLVAVVGIAFVAWRWRALAAIALVLVVLAGVAVAQPTIRRAIVHHTHTGLNSATSGRASLVANGIRIAMAHPVFGVGVGGFKHAYAERLHLRGKAPKVAASHDAPVTVAAETGIVGLALATWLAVAVLVAAFRRLDGSFRGRASLVFGLAIAAILCHSLFYNDFFEDPMTWMLFGLVAVAAGREGEHEAAAEPAAEPEAVPV